MTIEELATRVKMLEEQMSKLLTIIEQLQKENSYRTDRRIG